MAKAKGGRPAKLTPAVQGRIIAVIEAGHFRESAARLAGILPATLYKWLSAETEPYLACQDAVEAAEAELEGDVLEVVGGRIPDDARPATSVPRQAFPRTMGSGAPMTTPREEPPANEPPPQVNVLVVDRDELQDEPDYV